MTAPVDPYTSAASLVGQLAGSLRAARTLVLSPGENHRQRAAEALATIASHLEGLAGQLTAAAQLDEAELDDPSGTGSAGGRLALPE